MIMHFFTTNYPLLFSLAVISAMTYFTGEFILFAGYDWRAKCKIQNPKKYWNLTCLIGILACAESSYIFYVKMPISMTFCAASIMFWCGSILLDPPPPFAPRCADEKRPITEKKVVGSAWLLASLVLGIFTIVIGIIELWYH